MTFVQVDVGGAVDVMRLIEKVTSKDGYRRDDGGLSLDEMLRMGYEEGEDDDDDDGDDGGWLDEDGEEADDYDDDEGEADYDDENYDDENDIIKEGIKMEGTDANFEGAEDEDDGWVDFEDEDDVDDDGKGEGEKGL